MTFSHDTEQALGTLVRLVNTLPEPGSQVDGMSTLEDLEKFVHDREFSAVRDLGPDDLAEVRALRHLFAPVFTTESDSEAATLINAIIARGTTTPKLTNHDGHAWHIHYSRDEASLACRSATATPAPAATACTSPPTANASAPPADRSDTRRGRVAARGG